METSALLQFIRLYREMESRELAFGYFYINNIAPSHQVAHVRDQWRSKKKEFGRFFLNIDAKLKINLLDFWDIDNPGAEEYLAKIKADPFYAIFNELPANTEAIRIMVLFFENHAISLAPHSGITLQKLPAGKKQFGNAKNWGDYVLSLDESAADVLLQGILTHYKG